MLERPAFRVTILVLWAAILAYAFVASPPEDEALRDALLRGSLTGRFGGVEPSVAAVFCALGILPILMASFLVPDGRGRRPPAWPFANTRTSIGQDGRAP